MASGSGASAGAWGARNSAVGADAVMTAAEGSTGEEDDEVPARTEEQHLQAAIEARHARLTACSALRQAMQLALGTTLYRHAVSTTCPADHSCCNVDRADSAACMP